MKNIQLVNCLIVYGEDYKYLGVKEIREENY